MLISSTLGGGGMTPTDALTNDFTLRNSYLFEAERITNQTFTSAGFIDFDSPTLGSTGLFTYDSDGSGHHGLRAIKDVLCYTYFEADADPAVVTGTYSMWLRIFGPTNSMSWAPGSGVIVLATTMSVLGYIEFGPQYLFVPKNHLVTVEIRNENGPGSFDLTYADMELVVMEVGT